MVGGKIKFVDRKELIYHTYGCPVKQRRATLGSDPLRDSRMRLRRIFRPGKSQPGFPTFSWFIIPSCI